MLIKSKNTDDLPASEIIDHALGKALASAPSKHLHHRQFGGAALSLACEKGSAHPTDLCRPAAGSIGLSGLVPTQEEGVNSLGFEAKFIDSGANQVVD